MTTTGKVYLVGAGPGDPGLITVRGLRLLQQADLVLYDGLVNPLLLRHTSAQAERTCRAPEGDNPRIHQEEINSRLIAAARAGKMVVRLKGGDPYIFGRGSEEAAALQAAGIAYEVVPGISAATAASVYAGFSLTHRDYSSAVAFITGHEHPDKAGTSLDYTALACFPGTLVFYMGLHRLEEIVASLISHGKSPEVSAAVISRGTWPQQKTVTAPLAQLPLVTRQAGLHAPSLIVVGECVRLRDSLQWFEQRPLFGQSLGLTRPEGQLQPLLERVSDWGGEAVILPTIAICPPDDWSAVDAALQSLQQWDWLVFTSANGVRHFLDRLWGQGGDWRRLGHLRIAAIGPGTAQVLAEYHLRADLVPEEYRSEALAAALLPRVQGQRVLWARASRGRDVLPTELRAAGVPLTELVVYQHEDIPAYPPEILQRLEQGHLDWVCLSSPAIARQFAAQVTPGMRHHIGQRVKLASISPVTSEALRELELPISAEAKTYTWDGLLQAIVDYRPR